MQYKITRMYTGSVPYAGCIAAVVSVYSVSVYGSYNVYQHNQLPSQKLRKATIEQISHVYVVLLNVYLVSVGLENVS